MGRIARNTVTYESIDCDFFQKEKMFRLQMDLGEIAPYRAMHLLLWIGKTTGFYVPMNKYTASRFAKQELGNMSLADDIDALIQKLIEIGFFTEYKEGEEVYLSSPDIIRDWLTIVSKARRKINYDGIPNVFKAEIEQISESVLGTAERRSIGIASESTTPDPKPRRAKKTQTAVQTDAITEAVSSVISENDYDIANKVIDCWNEFFAGTDQSFPKNDVLPQMLVMQVRALRATDKEYPRLRKAFQNARTSNFKWTLWDATKNQKNFDKLIAGNSDVSRTDSKNKGVLSGAPTYFSDPNAYRADAFK